MIADLVYREVNGWRGTIDLYLPDRPTLHAALLYFHGGGWKAGSKAAAAAHAPYWLRMGLAVAAASYRLTETAPAPAAAEDAQAALDWLREHAAEYGIDPARIVTGGHSAGGLLALITAFRHDSPPAAAVAWSAHGDLFRYYADRTKGGDPDPWLARSADPEGVARALSPLHCVRGGLPPTLLIHSDRDPVVPYLDAARLAAALTEVGVANELVTLRSDAHLSVDHPLVEAERGHAHTSAFLARHGVLT